MTTEQVINIAKVAHMANKAFCETLGDNTQLAWEFAPEWQRASAINGVEFHVNNHDTKPSDSHDNWLKVKEADGWKYGPIKDPVKKEHPCFVPYDQLPDNQKMKDFLFVAVVKALASKV